MNSIKTEPTLPEIIGEVCAFIVLAQNIQIMYNVNLPQQGE